MELIIQLPETLPRVESTTGVERKTNNFSEWLNYIEESNRLPFKEKLTFINN